MTYANALLHCDECGKTESVFTKRFSLVKTSWMQRLTLPGWRTHREETETGVIRRDVCPTCTKAGIKL